MSLLTKKHELKVTNPNYCCTVVNVPDNLHKMPGADRLQICTVFANNIIVGLDTKVGDLMLFFPVESQLGLTFAVKNDLLRRKDANGKQCGGMFDENNRRVRCLKLRNFASEGFLCPIGHLSTLGIDISQLKVGDEFNEIDEYLICTKYLLPTDYSKIRKERSERKNRGPKEVSRLIPGQFNFHFDTSKLARNSHRITPDTLVGISEKYHGTSVVISNCRVTRKLRWYEKFLQKLGVKIDDKEYDLIYSSRRVVQNGKMDCYYGTTDNIYKDAAEKFRGLLYEGETIYAELVGYTSSGKFIQKNYDFGNLPGQFSIYIYRITKTGTDGRIVEYSFPQLKERCIKLGFNHVKEIFYGKAKDSQFAPLDIELEGGVEKFGEVFANNCKKYVDSLGLEPLCISAKVPAEGLVIRLDGQMELESFKCKAFDFLNHETKNLDDGIEDMESEESTGESDG